MEVEKAITDNSCVFAGGHRKKATCESFLGRKLNYMKDVVLGEKETVTLPNGDILPRFIYKYHPINDNLLSLIKENYVWFSNPEGFNDPYDCNLKWTNTITDDTIESYLRFQNKLKPGFWKAEQLEENIKYTKANKEEFSSFLDNEAEIIIRESGICCFSLRRDILLMWSHYSDKHSGVCLKFDMKADNKLFSSSSLVKVHYPDEYPKFDYISYVPSTGGNFQGNLIQFCVGTKSKEWEYEYEVRLARLRNFHEPFRDRIYFNKEALIGITFGYKTEKAKAKDILDSCNDCGYKLSEIDQSRLNDRRFGLTFDKFVPS